jgi:peptidoglycan/LPS O-acetylase OafA/YrhL
MTINKNKIQSLGFLRGIAVLMVCFCHFGAPLIEGSAFSELFKLFKIYGECGVQVFFVISGFVIPLSMDKGGYRIVKYFTFLYKRVLRLHPPYLFALFLTFAIVVVSNQVKHIPFDQTFS